MWIHNCKSFSSFSNREKEMSRHIKISLTHSAISKDILCLKIHNIQEVQTCLISRIFLGFTKIFLDGTIIWLSINFD